MLFGQNYDFLAPVWQGEISYNESFLPLEGMGGSVIPLLYRATEIIEVRDSSLQKVYEPGRDYELRDGGIFLPDTTTIPRMTWEEYNPQIKSPNAFTDVGFICSKGGYLFFAEGKEMHTRQCAVTYRHENRIGGDVWGGVIPQPLESRLPGFKYRLAHRQASLVGFTGDSIPAGGNSSGFTKTAPFLPCWPQMFCAAVSEKSARCELMDRTRGGMSSQWGVDTALDSFRGLRPNLVVIAYGMNDASGEVPSHTLAENYDKIATIIDGVDPGCEFLFVSTTLPNPLAPQFFKKHAEQEALLYALADKWGSRAAVVPMTSVHRYLLSRKRFCDMTGNNINHPNDYLARVYAQSLLSTVGYYGL